MQAERIGNAEKLFYRRRRASYGIEGVWCLRRSVMIDPFFQWDRCSGAKMGHSVVACDRRVVDWRSACRWGSG